MIQEVIDSIVEAENRAETMVKDAVAAAKDEVAKASSQAEEKVAQAKLRAKAIEKENALNAQKTAQEEYKKALCENEKKITSLAKQTQNNKDKAIEVIIGRIEEKYARR